MHTCTHTGVSHAGANPLHLLADGPGCLSFYVCETRRREILGYVALPISTARSASRLVGGFVSCLFIKLAIGGGDAGAALDYQWVED